MVLQICVQFVGMGGFKFLMDEYSVQSDVVLNKEPLSRRKCHERPNLHHSSEYLHVLLLTLAVISPLYYFEIFEYPIEVHYILIAFLKAHILCKFHQSYHPSFPNLLLLIPVKLSIDEWLLKQF